ncbi:copper chaperone PCu(A)C [Palleronia caenipelagi]|uniref:Copper chaperone PCu(A)C n=1 Tax=Palleronia caenipelagi TaxID=2489174 RepID=A0A547QB41_9RHOB|nr:copper chaperone PCu(A)C [Palleronia caenipelagi]TRD23603.1 copper chaperone PCu(A)C [Palleronia caenipelagi]
MMTRFSSRLMALTLPALLPLAAMADDASALRISDPVIYATPPMAKAAGGYMLVENTGETDDTLVNVTSEDVPMVQLHRSMNVDGVMKMEHQDAIHIPAGESVVFKRGDYHVMFIKLDSPMTEGDDITVTLEFENAGAVPVTFTVIPRPE